MTKKNMAPPYEPTESEAACLADIQVRKKAKRSIPKVTVREHDGVATFAIEVAGSEPDTMALFMHSIATVDSRFADGLLRQLMNATPRVEGELDTQAFDLMLSVVSAVEPRDEIEAMLATHMAVLHAATMTFARRLENVDNIPQQDSAERAFNKLAQIFTAQMEALNRYRGEGRQKMTVEHVHVYDGGQAVVGDVHTGGRGASKKGGPTP